MYKYDLGDFVYVIKDLHVQRGLIVGREHSNQMILCSDKDHGEFSYIIYILIFHIEARSEHYRYHEENCFESSDKLAFEIGKSIPVVDEIETEEGLYD